MSIGEAAVAHSVFGSWTSMASRVTCMWCTYKEERERGVEDRMRQMLPIMDWPCLDR